jgi:hypothetical protein
MRVNLLVATTLALVVLNTIAAVVAIDHGWPGAFGTHRDPHRVSHDWLLNGSAISAPAPPLIVLVVATLLSLSRNRLLGAVGAAGCIVIGVVFVIATIGEPTMFHPESALEELFHALGLVLAATLVVAGALELRARLIRRGQPVS